MDINKVKDWLKVGLLLLSLIVIGNLWWNLRGLLRDLRGTTENLRNTSKEFNDYWVAQRQVLESTKNQKAVEAALAVGATYQATGRLINTQVIPAVLAQLRSSTAATDRLEGLVGEGSRLVADTNTRVNQELLPEIVAGTKSVTKLVDGVNVIAQGTGASVEQVIGALNHLVAMGDVTVQTVNQRLADPKLDDLVTAALSTTQHAAGITANLDAATAELPPITKQARRFQKPLQFAQLAAILMSIFRPY